MTARTLAPLLLLTVIFFGCSESDEAKDLASLLEGAGADVDIHWENFGHQLTQSEIQAAAAWYKNKF